MEKSAKVSNWNLPNAISLYRLLSFPFLLYLIFAGNESLFAIMLCINLVSDAVDGLIARLFKLQTELGARLDSMADWGTYILAFTGIYQFKMDDHADHFWLLYVFIGLIVSYNLFSLLKFGRMPSLHMYSTKIGGYIQGIYFFGLFAFGFNTPIFYIAMLWGWMSSLEEIIILIYLKKLRSNVKGLYWVLQEGRG
ncbi:MAG: CDP-alcohol phosphatidyltransferase family protein [Sphingobacteriaceae bacterium]|jgi:cardiolipin synthase|nr:CDP-alcohol phosphatidyltransferase family protein [Sphingobacteriaceae bacterium]